MKHEVAVARLQLQVVKAYKAGLAKAQEKVKFYEDFLKSGGMDEGQKESLKLAVRIHQHEVNMYKELLVSAVKKLRG